MNMIVGHGGMFQYRDTFLEEVGKFSLTEAGTHFHGNTFRYTLVGKRTETLRQKCAHTGRVHCTYWVWKSCWYQPKPPYRCLYLKQRKTRMSSSRATSEKPHSGLNQIP